jgi:sortase A
LKAAALPEHVAVKGMIGTLPWQAELSPADTAERSGISVYWARQKIADLIVLADAGGHALAFGPAHVAGSSMPGEKGTTVLTGHRDTHFSFVRKLKSGDFLSMDMPDGRRLRYIVRDAAVIDGRTGAIASDDIPRLALVTCYPFHTVTPGGPLRFVVMSDLDPATRPQ